MQNIGSVGHPMTGDGPVAQTAPGAAVGAESKSSAPAAPALAGPHQRPDAPTLAELKAAVEQANRQLDQSNRELTFVFDDKLGRMLVKIVDTRTNTVIRQVPSEDMLAAARALSGASTRGTLLRDKA
jgi:flagellar protein FlaG